jgi:hypothetical protein
MARTPPPRPHPLARSKRAEQVNALLGKAWDKGWLPTPALDPAALWAIAAKPFGARASKAETCGRSAEDIDDFRERLSRMCESLVDEADLNPLGQAMAYGQLMRVVRNRLALGDLWQKKSELLKTRLAPPIIVIGHMRSGTTRIHKLLTADPAFSHTRYCDAYRPVPRSFGLNRIASALEIKMLGVLNPWMQSIHPMSSAGVEEELAWISAALHHSIYESQWHIPAYSAWSEMRDPSPIYREFLRMFRTDAATRRVAAKPRVLKVPAFAEDLATLLRLLPEARLVLTSRDHEAVLKSAVSLSANQMAIQSDSCDLAAIEALWQHKIGLREERISAALAEWKGPVARLAFDELDADWEGAMQTCYRQLGLALSPEALAGMSRVMAGSRKGDHHAHAGQLARFGEKR